MKDRLVVGVVQPELRALDETPLQATKRNCDMIIHASDEAAAAAPATSDDGDGDDDANFDLFVLPELAPVGYSEDTFRNFLPSTPEKRQLFERIDQELINTAKRCDAYICYGTIGWKDESDGDDTQCEYYIRQKVVDPSGAIVASYDKIYLCDYGDCNETRFFTPGKDLSTFVCKGWQIGIIVCADIRCPLLCRRLASTCCIQQEEDSSSPSVLDTCQVILQPACFSRDLSFRTWKSFRETRAVENGVYLVATNYAGDYYGECSVTPPWVDEDHEPMEWQTQAGVYRAVLQRRSVRWARENMPYYRHMIQDGVS